MSKLGDSVVMANKVVTRRELLDRWRGIEEDDDDVDDISSFDHLKLRRFRQLKEDWFSDAFNFLIYLPKENHIWCGAWDLMGPLMETFYNYYKDKRHDSPLKLLWKRISEELRQCTQCISQHHQAQEMYSVEYDLSSIGPLLDVLQSLDEERVTEHLKEINARIAHGEYDPMHDNVEIVSVLFEVLMFPVLLDDQSLVSEFQMFIEAVDDSHELTLAGHQQYPGVYALLFLKSRRARSIGFRLAGYVGKLRSATDLEPLQPLLKKCIGFLETEQLPSTTEGSRPRMQLERITVWLGIKALLGFLEPPAFEEGILERYPVLLSIVLNHISDDSLEFSYAVNCLRLLFEMLGCKLWLRATLSPSVMRNTLLGQCFHTRNEKSHKEIFDLFQPFLQSLEALQDGEHEKQRRHFLYFLLHQVTVSSNFSILMRKKACQIALRIIHRGYKMDPPCPPFECAHMWGPSLVSSLKDSSLHSSLRQPAFDLIETIIVSDAASLAATFLNCCTPPTVDRSIDSDFIDEDDDERLPFLHDVEEKGVNCWNGFSTQSKTTSRAYDWWMCIPMLWFDVLVEIDQSVLPVSFSKAVFWALSRLSVVESENITEMSLPVRNWLATCASEISHLFGWKVPSGSDDGGNGTESKNSVKVSAICIPLMRTFKRLTINFVVRMEQSELRKQWTWEPRMGESVILLLVDPDDNARQVGRRILEQVSNTRGLACGLQFLCSCSSSLSAVFLGLRHALKLVQVDSVLLKFQALHHFWFVLCKLLKEGIAPSQILPGNSSADTYSSKFSSQGGFLQQPVFDSLPNDISDPLSVDCKSWEMFSCLLAEIAWPSVLKCLLEGKAFIDYKVSQMTCIRLLEILPIVFERLRPSFQKISGKQGNTLESGGDVKWLHDLMDWGKSSLPVIVRYWKQTVVSLLGVLKGSCSDYSISAIRAIEKLISCDNIPMDELTMQVSRLSVSLMREDSCTFEKINLKSKPLSAEGLPFKRSSSDEAAETFSSDDADVQILDSATLVKKDKDNLIVLSDDEMDTGTPANDITGSDPGSTQSMLDGKRDCAGEIASKDDLAKKHITDNSKDLQEGFHQEAAPDYAGLVSRKLDSETREKVGLASHIKPEVVDVRQDINSKISSHFPLPFHDKSNLKNKSVQTFGSKITDSIPSQQAAILKNYSGEAIRSKSMDKQSINKVSQVSKIVMKELVHDAEDDPLEFALKAARRQQSNMIKPSAFGLKRQVIQLNLPLGNRSANLHRLDGGHKRFKPPRLDDWYRSILEINYFIAVGLASASERENQTAKKLKEVPVCFQSPDEYVAIFRPLVLEEFKAQLRSSYLESPSLDEMSCGGISVMSVERIDDFQIVRCVCDDTSSTGSRSLFDNDLILLTRQPLQKSAHDVHMVGKVERREKDNRRLNVIVIRFYLQNGCSRLNRARKLLVERSKWYMSRLMSITPQLREFQALSLIKDIPLLPNILNPVYHPLGLVESGKEEFSKLSLPLQRILKSSYNDSQLQAISAAANPLDSKKDFALSLIQGPPGTGKTRTIVAIVSALLALNDERRLLNHSQPNTSCSNAKMSQSAAIARAWQDAALARQLNVDDEKSCKSMGSSTRGRVLICAQSNAAVDELISRISSEGLYGSDGALFKPYLVRVGNVKTVHPNSLPYFIDTLVDHRLKEHRMNEGDVNNGLSGDSSAVLRSNLEKLVDQIRFYETKRANLRDVNSDPKCLLEGEIPKGENMKVVSASEIEAKLRKLHQEKKAMYTDLATAQSREKKAYEESKALKHKLRKSILREAEIVVATLSGCGGDLYGVCSESFSSHKFSNSSEYTLFDVVVIDEAAQALEPATLIPLQLLKSKGTKCVMVGDPKQLPATVLSNVASKYLYQCSMFERLQRAGHPVIMLTKQYRMHPEICRFPSLHFYNNKLLNGDKMSSKVAPFHATECLGPYVFFDVIDGQELHGRNSGALSLYNECEADAAVEVLRFFRIKYPSEFVGGRIGIVTPYRSQLSLLRSRFSNAFGSSVTAEMEFNTVDGFQGREVDILVLSTVRAAEPCCESPTGNIGFVADVRRMNVSLTRAKLSLWILGNARTLQTNENWAALVRDVKERNLVISVAKPYDSVFESAFEKNSVNDMWDLKHAGKVKEASRHAEQQKNVKNRNERKRKYMGVAAYDNSRVGGDDPAMEADKTNKRRAKHEPDFSTKKGCGSAAVKRTAKDMKFTNRAVQVVDDESRGNSGEKQLNADAGEGKACQLFSSNSVDHSEQVTRDVRQLEKSVALKGVKEPFESCGRRQRNKDIWKPSSLASQDGNVEALRTSNQTETPNDATSKRKQQRDAVDALLSSALISTKKSEPSSKSVPVKRPLSPAKSASRAIKPPKPKKVITPASPTSAAHDQIRPCHRNKR